MSEIVLPRVAALQMTSSGNLDANLAQASALIKEAVSQGAQLLVLPEYFAYHGCGGITEIAQQEKGRSGPARTFLSDQAQQHKVWLVGGTIPVATSCGLFNKGADEESRALASCFVIDDKGHEVVCYQKMHLFDVQVDDTHGSYRESKDYCHGKGPVVVDTPFGRLGLSVCYDLRFPELYRYLADHGAELIVVPSAFTVKTGEAHWQLLLKARAVENLSYIVGANMGDRHHPKRPTWGGSVIIDPWGNIIEELDDGPGVIVADVDLNYLKKLRQKMPVYEHRRFGVVKPSN